MSSLLLLFREETEHPHELLHKGSFGNDLKLLRVAEEMQRYPNLQGQVWATQVFLFFLFLMFSADFRDRQNMIQIQKPV